MWRIGSETFPGWPRNQALSRGNRHRIVNLTANATLLQLCSGSGRTPARHGEESEGASARPGKTGNGRRETANGKPSPIFPSSRPIPSIRPPSSPRPIPSVHPLVILAEVPARPSSRHPDRRSPPVFPSSRRSERSERVEGSSPRSRVVPKQPMGDDGGEDPSAPRPCGALRTVPGIIISQRCGCVPPWCGWGPA